jgi:hypothetical protein
LHIKLEKSTLEIVAPKEKLTENALVDHHQYSDSEDVASQSTAEVGGLPGKRKAEAIQAREVEAPSSKKFKQKITRGGLGGMR